MSSQHSKPNCVMCNRQPKEAISIAGYVLCEDCEERIVRCDPSDPDYDHIIAQLREFWRGLAEAAASRD